MWFIFSLYFFYFFFYSFFFFIFFFVSINLKFVFSGSKLAYSEDYGLNKSEGQKYHSCPIWDSMGYRIYFEAFVLWRWSQLMTVRHAHYYISLFCYIFWADIFNPHHCVTLLIHSHILGYRFMSKHCEITITGKTLSFYMQQNEKQEKPHRRKSSKIQ